MPNSTTPKAKPAKNNEPARLATNQREWADLDALVRQHVERICARDQEQAESLCLLLDLITSERYDRIDRDGVLLVAQAHAFTFTAAFETAQNICLQKLPQGTELRMVA